MNGALAVFDQGNTSVAAGCWLPDGALAGPARAPRGDLAALERAWGELAVAPAAALIASVSPPDLPALEEWCRRRLGLAALVAGRDLPVPVANRTREPERVGVDRLLNALAAWRRLGAPAVVVDCGTAVTFDVVGPQGEFLGGAIAPGPSLAARCLHRYTALLPELGGAPAGPTLGRTTAEAVASGLRHGLAGLVQSVLAGLRAECPWKFKVLATGGDWPPGLELPERGEYVPALTLEGLRWTWEAAPAAGAAGRPAPRPR